MLSIFVLIYRNEVNLTCLLYVLCVAGVWKIDMCLCAAASCVSQNKVGCQGAHWPARNMSERERFLAYLVYSGPGYFL